MSKSIRNVHDYGMCGGLSLRKVAVEFVYLLPFLCVARETGEEKQQVIEIDDDAYTLARSALSTTLPLIWQ